MTSNIRRVSEAEAMGEAPAAPDDQSRPTVEGGTFMQRVRPDFLAAAQLAVREAEYPNSAAERDAVERVDRDVLDRVSRIDDRLADQARVLLEHSKPTATAGSDKPTVMQEAAVAWNELLDIERELERGRIDTAALADRYAAVRRAVENRLGARLIGNADQAKALRAQLEDPYAHAQKLLSLLPIASVRPIGLG